MCLLGVLKILTPPMCFHLLVLGCLQWSFKYQVTIHRLQIEQMRYHNIRSAEQIFNRELAAIQDTYHTHCLRKANIITIIRTVCQFRPAGSTSAFSCCTYILQWCHCSLIIWLIHSVPLPMLGTNPLLWPNISHYKIQYCTNRPNKNVLWLQSLWMCCSDYGCFLLLMN